MSTDPTPGGVAGAPAGAMEHLVPRAVRPIDIEHDELMARAAAEYQARTAVEEARKATDRAVILREAADFLCDAHFRDGLSVQEIGTALRHMADEADPMVGSLARGGVGLDEIAGMPAAKPVAVPYQALRDRVAEALLDHLSRTADIRPDRNGDLAFMPEVTDEERMRLTDAVLSVLPPDGRADTERLARVHEWVTGEVVTAKTEFGDGYRAALRDIRDLIKGRFDNDAANDLRRLAAGERDEQQAHQPEHTWTAELRDPLAEAAGIPVRRWTA